MNYELILETYSLEELFELNDVTEEEVLEFLVSQSFLELPEIMPVDL